MSEIKNKKSDSVKVLFHDLLDDEIESKLMDLIVDGKEPEEILRVFIDKWR